MSIMEEIRQLKTDPKTLRSFGLVVGGVLVGIWALLWGLDRFVGRGGDFPWLWMVGGALILLGAVLPRVLKPVYLLWMGLAVVLGFFVSRIILTIFFFLVLTPVGLFFRLTGRDVLKRKLEPDAETYWIPKENLIADRSRYEKFF